MVEEFKIVLATIEDMKDVFDLSNDELVRANSFNPEKIQWEDHQKWYKNKINDKNCSYYLIKDFENNLISQVRLDKINASEGNISISVSARYRGKGYGAKVLQAVSKKIIYEQYTKKINAYIKNENAASKSVFEKAGFVLKEKYTEKVRYEFNAK